MKIVPKKIGNSMNNYPGEEKLLKCLLLYVFWGCGQKQTRPMRREMKQNKRQKEE